MLPLDQVVVLDGGMPEQLRKAAHLQQLAGSRFADMVAAQEGEGENIPLAQLLHQSA